MPDHSMPESFSALRVHQEDRKTFAQFDDIAVSDLSAGDIVIKTKWSGINYKDALAISGKGKIMKSFPMVAGIDVAGVVVSSEHPDFQPGDEVIGAGAGFGEDFDGGYAEYARLRSETAVPLPAGLSMREAMAIGTAGFTAALAIQQMEHNGSKPEDSSAEAPIAVTGPTGGVGSVAIDLLKNRGYTVAALTHKPGSEAYLESLGADEVIVTAGLEMGGRPLEKTRFAGGIDNVGGEVLSWLCRSTRQWGNVASIGLAASHELHCSVMPFILRGVNLLGINSVYPPQELRLKTWQRLGSDLKPGNLELMVTNTIGMQELPKTIETFIDGSNVGRTLVEMD